MGALWNRVRRLWKKTEIAAVQVDGNLQQMQDEQMALGMRPGAGPLGSSAASGLGMVETALHGPNPMFEQVRDIDVRNTDQTVARLQSEMDEIPDGAEADDNPTTPSQ